MTGVSQGGLDASYKEMKCYNIVLLEKSQNSLVITYNNQYSWSTFFFKIFYLFIHERHTERERKRHRQREKQAPCREPDVGLDPRSPGSRPGPKAVLKPLSHWGCPSTLYFILQMELNRLYHFLTFLHKSKQYNELDIQHSHAWFTLIN